MICCFPIKELDSSNRDWCGHVSIITLPSKSLLQQPHEKKFGLIEFHLANTSSSTYSPTLKLPNFPTNPQHSQTRRPLRSHLYIKWLSLREVVRAVEIVVEGAVDVAVAVDSPPGVDAVSFCSPIKLSECCQWGEILSLSSFP